MLINLFADGACSGNPGPGGWGVVLMSGQHRKELSGKVEMTTNNRMELTAVLEGLKAIKAKKAEVTIRSDSKNVCGWIGSNWKTKVPEIKALVDQIKEIVTEKELTISCIHTGDGNPEIARCHNLAH